MALHGKTGNLTVGSAIVNLTSWSLSLIGETGEASSMGDTFAQHLVGMTDFNASAEGKSQLGLDTIALLGSGDAAAAFIMEEATSQYAGGAIVTGFTETAVIDDVITVSYTIEGNDAAIPAFTVAGAAASGQSNAIHGKTITAQYGDTPTAFTGLRGWTVTGSVPVSDASEAHPTDNGRQKLAGIKSISATVTILTPPGELPWREGDPASKLYLAREASISYGEYQGATAIFTGAEAGVDSTNTEITTMSFIYTDTVTIAVV